MKASYVFERKIFTDTMGTFCSILITVTLVVTVSTKRKVKSTTIRPFCQIVIGINKMLKAHIISSLTTFEELK